MAVNNLCKKFCLVSCTVISMMGMRVGQPIDTSLYDLEPITSNELRLREMLALMQDDADPIAVECASFHIEGGKISSLRVTTDIKKREVGGKLVRVPVVQAVSIDALRRFASLLGVELQQDLFTFSAVKQEDIVRGELLAMFDGKVYKRVRVNGKPMGERKDSVPVLVDPSRGVLASLAALRSYKEKE